MTNRRRSQRRTTNDQRRLIKFGTDGWRAVIADDFTFDNVRRVAGGIASYVLKHEDAARGLIIGYDTRFGSPLLRGLRRKSWQRPAFRVKLSNDCSADSCDFARR